VQLITNDLGLVDRIEWTEGWPTIHDGSPSRTWQPWPGAMVRW
jgi:hypothetical protein